MIMNKKFLFSIILFLLLLTTACSRSGYGEDILMDELASDGKYHYTNKALGFSVNFPEQFIYYQTQRADTEKYMQVEFFAPTSDRAYPQQIQSYGKFLVVAVYNSNDYEENKDHEIFGKKDKKTFVGTFWENAPSDWSEKWSEKTKQEIISSFKIN